MTRKASLILRHIEGIACHTRNVKTKYVPYLQKACTYVEFLHTRNAYPIAGHLDPSVRHYQNQAGISKCVLSDTRTLPHMSIPWFDTFRQYLNNINGRLELTQSWQLKPQRENDTFLMENFLNLKTFTPKEMKILNACRMYYQVTRVSDITTPDGSRLMAKISNGMLSWEQFNVVYKPQNEWPEQERPNKTSWKLWQKALRLTVCNVCLLYPSDAADE